METNYEERKTDIIQLRYVDGWTLQRIADKYEISRERVRQIIGNTGHIAVKKTDRLKDDKFLEKTANMTNGEIAELLDLSNQTVSNYRSHIRHAIEDNGGPPARGAEIEIIVSDRLSDAGIHNELMPYRNKFDILALDFIRIDVKSAHKERTAPSLKLINPMWGFKIQPGKKRTDIDFYICFIVPTEELFVIPANIIPENREYIAFCWPTARPEIGKYQRYLDAYHLITEFAEQQETSLSTSNLITSIKFHNHRTNLKSTI